MSIPFIDLQAQRARIAAEIDAAIGAVLEHGRFLFGPEVDMLEGRLADWVGARSCVACASGTDALALPLMAWGIKPGDAVFCPSFTFAATAEVVAWMGATPVFVDILPDTYNIDPESLEAAIAAAPSMGLTPKAVIAVDLFGQLADYVAIAQIARAHGLKLISDCAQSFGATLNGAHPISWADAQTTSFFPAKPLGCYGDGGAVLLNDAELDTVLRSLRNHGAGTDRYDNSRIGMNSRLASIQAAVLIEKLNIFADEIERRNAIAARYAERLAGHVRATPKVIEGGVSTWAQYTIEHDEPDALVAHLKERDLPAARYYPRPMHQQTAYEHYPSAPGGLAVTDAVARRVVSLPMHPYLEAPVQDQIIDAVVAFALAKAR